MQYVDYRIEAGESITVNFADHKDWICSQVKDGVATLFPDHAERSYVLMVPVDKVEYETYGDDGGEYVEFYCSIGDCRRVYI